MTAEFERFKQDVHGHSILITSWYDVPRRTWWASAPAYSHVLSSSGVTKSGSASRKEAISSIVGVLTDHFRKKDKSA